MSSLLLALQFLTVIPIRIRNVSEQKMAQALLYFPFVGLCIGLILTGINQALFIFDFRRLAIDIILTVALVLVTGGMHLDGLADTFDAIFSHKDREQMLKIMRDSHMGVMGALGIISILLLKIAFLYSLSLPLKAIALFLMCILSRWALVFAMFFFPYAREEGKVKVFIENINLRIFLLCTLVALILAFAAWQIKGLLLLGITALFTWFFAHFMQRILGGITGDTLGAINELNEIIILFTLAISGRS